MFHVKHSQTDDWIEGGFGLYLHWPFCKAKCPYCDFNSHVRSRIDQADWQKAYLAELDRAAEETGGRVLRSVFFGGGTPSLMEPALVGTILERIAKHWRFANDVEITLEANPTSVEVDRFRGYRAAGVNRVSLGLQALNDTDLRRLGRQHSAAEGLAAMALAREVFDRVSGDLIYARQNQSLEDWGKELSSLIALGPDHLSLYQLTIEEGTAFGALHQAGKLRDLPSEDLAADMYLLTEEICTAAGLNAYEVSNYAKTGAESRHNQIYWHMGDYLGIGPGAHGRLTLNGQRYATDTERSPEKWLSRVNDLGNGELPRETLGLVDQAEEYLIMGLRLEDGISLSRLTRMSGRAVDAKVLADLAADDLITVQGDRLAATKAGRLVLNALILKLAGA